MEPFLLFSLHISLINHSFDHSLISFNNLFSSPVKCILCAEDHVRHIVASGIEPTSEVKKEKTKQKKPFMVSSCFLFRQISFKNKCIWQPKRNRVNKLSSAGSLTKCSQHSDLAQGRNKKLGIHGGPHMGGGDPSTCPVTCCLLDSTAAGSWTWDPESAVYSMHSHVSYRHPNWSLNL